MPVLNLQGRQVTYRVVKGTSRRYVYFKFRQDLTLDVLLPRTREVNVDQIIEEKEDWILKKYEELKDCKKVLDEGKIMFNGRYLKPVIVKGNVQKPAVRNEQVIFYTDKETGLNDLIREWFTGETSEYLKEALLRLADKLGVSYIGVEVRQIKRWGSCTRKGRLTFNSQLIALPENLRDYVVLHELAHLSEFNHSRSFHKKLAPIYPDYKVRETELKHIVPM